MWFAISEPRLCTINIKFYQPQFIFFQTTFKDLERAATPPDPKLHYWAVRDKRRKLQSASSKEIKHN